jgi:hypothetical protein
VETSRARESSNRDETFSPLVGYCCRIGADDRMKKAQPTKGRSMHLAKPAFDPVSAALQQLHQSVANEAVPDDFLRILEEIDAKIAAAKPGAKR